MPQVPTTPKGNKNQVPVEVVGKKPLVPPEEEFWVRYSPHHEFPLSSATSFTLHFLAIAMLALIAWLLWSGEDTDSSLPSMEPVVVGQHGGGGGSKEGVGDAPGGEQPAAPQENVNEDTQAKNKPKNDADTGPVLDDTQIQSVPVDVGPSDGGRTIAAGKAVEELTDTGRRAHVESGESGGGAAPTRWLLGCVIGRAAFLYSCTRPPDCPSRR